MVGHICISVMDECMNLMDSYGEICVRCNCCGRFDEKTMYQCRIETYTRQKEENDNFNNWMEGYEELQRANVKSNSESFQKDIDEAKRQLEAQNDKR